MPSQPNQPGTPQRRPASAAPSSTGVPKTQLTPEQKLEALRRVQSQAEERVKLGVKLFKAAEAHAASHREALDEVRAEQKKFHDDIRREVARTLQGYDQWMGQIDESYKGALMNIEQRIDDLDERLERLQSKWERDEKRITQLLERSRSLLDESRQQHATPTPNPSPASVAQKPMQKSDQTPQAGTPAPPQQSGATENKQSTGRPPISRIDDASGDTGEQIFLRAIDKLDSPAKNPPTSDGTTDQSN